MKHKVMKKFFLLELHLIRRENRREIQLRQLSQVLNAILYFSTYNHRWSHQLNLLTSPFDFPSKGHLKFMNVTNYLGKKLRNMCSEEAKSHSANYFFSKFAYNDAKAFDRQPTDVRWFTTFIKRRANFFA